MFFLAFASIALVENKKLETVVKCNMFLTQQIECTSWCLLLRATFLDG